MKILSKMSVVAISMLLLHLAVVPNSEAQVDEVCTSECYYLVETESGSYMYFETCRCFEGPTLFTPDWEPKPFWERLEPHEDGANYKGPTGTPPPNHGGSPPISPGPSGPGGGPTP